MAEAAFSADGKFFSTISKDGRLKIWDTETNTLKQEYTPDLHLASPPTCIQWISVTQNTGSPSKAERRKSSTSDPGIQCIAIGTRSGKILIYSVANARIETVLFDDKNPKIHKLNISSLDWHKDYGLYSCNKENWVSEWDLESGVVRNKYDVNIEAKSKQGSHVGAMKIVSHNQESPAHFIVTCAWQVHLWRLHNGTADMIKTLGHSPSPKAILAVASVNNMCWLIEGSQTERILSFWDVTINKDYIPILNGDGNPSKKKRKKSIVTPVVPTPTYMFILEDSPKAIDVEVMEEDGGKRICVAAVTRSGVVHYYGHQLNGASAKPIKPSVTIQTTTSEAQPLPLVCCRLRGAGLLLGYVQGPALVFERVTPDLSTKTQVLIRGGDKKSKKQDKKEKVAEQVTYVEPMGGVASRKRTVPGGSIEVPMEERLANLTVDTSSRGQTAVNKNMTKLLMQGLHSKDKQLIQTVLFNENCDKSMAQHTVSALPPDYVSLLLEQLADLATKKTSQCAAVCTWVTAVLRCHSALLLAAVGANSNTHLMQLLAVFTHRRSHLCQLLNLKGRLELTLAQRSAAQEYKEHRPVLNYNDTSDEEMEIERYESDASEQSWDKSDSPSERGASGSDSDSDSAEKRKPRHVEESDSGGSESDGD